jgi:uncharacterized protein YndB with AHSA1/START domain
MTTPLRIEFDPALDLMIDRVLDVPRHLVWAAWTQPEHLRHWFCPAPWSVSHAEIDLQPGGTFLTVMRSPDGDEHPNTGCILKVVHEELLVFTDGLLPGFRPSGGGFMTGAVQLDPVGGGTRYRALAKHADEAARTKHEAMGFHGGWGTAADQMVSYIRANLS